MTIDLEQQKISTALEWTGRHQWTRYWTAKDEGERRKSRLANQ